MKKLVLYSRKINKVSGVQTFELAFLQHLHEFCDITVVYEVCEPSRFIQFSKYAKMVQNKGQLIECDTCVYSSLFHQKHKIKAEKYMQVVHAVLSNFKLKYNGAGIDLHVAVGEAVKKDLEKNYNINSVVIPNMLPITNIKPVLRLMTASRIQKGKGFERMAVMMEALKKYGLPWIWEIYGSGSRMYESQIRKLYEKYPEVHFMGAKDNVQNYMMDADFVVQLSDSEGFCYSMYEAVQVGTNIVVTAWEGLQKLDLLLESQILELDMSNLCVEDLYKGLLCKMPPSEIPSEVNKWQAIL